MTARWRSVTDVTNHPRKDFLLDAVQVEVTYTLWYWPQMSGQLFDFRAASLTTVVSLA